MALQKISDITRVCNQTNISDKVDCLILLKADYEAVKLYNQALLNGTGNAGNSTLAAIKTSLANPISTSAYSGVTYNYLGYSGLSQATMDQNLADATAANNEAKNQVTLATNKVTNELDPQIKGLQASPTFATEAANAKSKRSNYKIALIAGIIIVLVIVGLWAWKKYKK